jgi:aspartate aminotransferase-like enzyme
MNQRAFVGRVASRVSAALLGAFAQLQGKIWRVGSLGALALVAGCATTGVQAVPSEYGR